ncbi:MAG: GNAT family N-acetyltransferase [Paludibacteraceae bacterium]|nr:GNAT family N-acetyltransferase [Paludibacteraceae bacterium]
MYSFNVINFEQADWNFIEKSYDSTCYHSKEWISYLERIGCKLFIVEVKESDILIGYFIGAEIGVGIRFIVAPQEGVGTYTQGLCMQAPISEGDRLAIYKALAKWLFKRGIAHVLQVDDWQLRRTSATWISIDEFRHEILEQEGIEYSVRPTLCAAVNISEEEIWKQFHYTSCKYMINKAKKRGLYVKEITDYNEIKEFVQVHYEQLKDVCDRHGDRPSVSQHSDRMLALCESLFPNRVIMLEVIGKDQDGVEQIMSTGIFCLDKGQCSYWTGASYRYYQKYSPNELMVWEAMRLLNQRGGGLLNFCGMAEYKLKFGTKYEYVPRIVFAKHKWLVNILPWLKQQYRKIKHILKR